MSDQPARFAWGHINLNVRDLDRAVAFYELLGFTTFIPAIPYLGLAVGAEAAPVSDGSTKGLGLPQGTRGRACIMQLGDGFPKLDLTEFADLEQRPPLTNGDRGLVRLCLVSQDLKADHARLAAEGVEFLSPPQVCQDGMAELATCVDPDGALIELLQVHLDKWPKLPAGT
ncbi:MAG TPA: VOC family protein [Pseudomonadales bacterium]|nr:VOC family protein [Pseudomonadales bacterium]